MDQVLARLRGHRQHHVEVLQAYLRIPTISSDPRQRPAMDHGAQHTAHLFQWAGLEQVTVTPTAGHAVVTGCWRHAVNAPTLLIYGHYDVQPVDPLSEWTHDPFDPHVTHDRIVARGAADDKGQFFMYLAAIEAILRCHGQLPVNVVFLAEGEEEVGSVHLPAFLHHHRELLQADLALVSDSGMWAEGWPAVTMGLRGLIGMELQMTGANRDLHSGTYGGGVANPLDAMARLLASLKDDEGRVTIPGFYDKVRPPTPEEQLQLTRVPLVEADYWRELGPDSGPGGETGYTLLERLWFRPTLEINGLWGGFNGVGEKTVLPAKAWAKISCRLVPDQDPEEIAQLVHNWFLSQQPKGATLQVTRFPGSGRPLRVTSHLPALTAVKKALAEGFGREPLLIGDGASIPIVADFKEILGIDTLLIGFSLPDARCHSPNENLHLPTFHTGITCLARLMFLLAQTGV